MLEVRTDPPNKRPAHRGSVQVPLADGKVGGRKAWTARSRSVVYCSSGERREWRPTTFAASGWDAKSMRAVFSMGRRGPSARGPRAARLGGKPEYPTALTKGLHPFGFRYIGRLHGAEGTQYRDEGRRDRPGAADQSRGLTEKTFPRATIIPISRSIRASTTTRANCLAGKDDEATLMGGFRMKQAVTASASPTPDVCASSSRAEASRPDQMDAFGRIDESSRPLVKGHITTRQETFQFHHTVTDARRCAHPWRSPTCRVARPCATRSQPDRRHVEPGSADDEP